jgi:hypothetical protein
MMICGGYESSTVRGLKKQIVGIRYDFVVASPCFVDVYFP